MQPSNLSVFNNIKVVVFMETQPLSDRFEQIIFTQDQMKKVLDTVTQQMDGYDPSGVHKGFTVYTNDDHKYTFPDIPDCYTPEQAQKLKDEANAA